MTKNAAACILLSLMLGSAATAQEVPAAPNASTAVPPTTGSPSSAPSQGSPQAPAGATVAPGVQGSEGGQGGSDPQGRDGAPRWQYQSEQSSPRTYTQPTYGPSIAIEVEQMRNRVASLEDRAEKLERALGDAINLINAQTEAIQKLGGN